MSFWANVSEQMSLGKRRMGKCRITVFTPKALLPYRNVGQQQRALMVYSENVQLWYPFLAKSDTSDTFEKS
jgi:hypothetical protein